MNPSVPSLLIFCALLLQAQAGSKKFQYNDFGPQVAVHELIGSGWFQWQAHGGGNPHIDPRIKVVVYWNETLEQVKGQHPVDQAKLQDYRYLELNRAIKHLEQLIPEFKSMGLPTDRLQNTLETLEEISQKQAK